MADRQLLAKLGVVVLLGLNVGAYYLFWPKNNGCPTERAVLTPQCIPAQTIPAAPQNFPVAAAKNAESIGVPEAPVKKNNKAPDADEAVNKLLELIQKDKVEPIPDISPPIPAAPLFEAKPVDPLPGMPDPMPRPLPPLKTEPINGEASGATDPNVAIVSGQTPKSQSSPWLVNVKQSGAQTLVTARLRRGSATMLPVEFEILCDRVDPIGADGLRAFGNVTFAGAGIKGACKRLTVPWNSPSLVFEDQVRITPDNPRGSQLRGERFVWEQPANDVDVNATEFRPAGVMLPLPPPPGGLGSPK